MLLLTLRLKKVPASDGTPGKYDVVTVDRVPPARWPWHYSSRPDYRNRYVFLNCYRYRIEWVKP